MGPDKDRLLLLKRTDDSTCTHKAAGMRAVTVKDVTQSHPGTSLDDHRQATAE